MVVVARPAMGGCMATFAAKSWLATSDKRRLYFKIAQNSSDCIEHPHTHPNPLDMTVGTGEGLF